ncbi:hypothetical protein [Sphingomonas sp. Leaf208]|uniref:hypothetical protein n=1 Tax=Sphingomonas sp. Leaf208 TaxID=1735679 RepID=UPI000A96045E|nr:hypothetical protein [Sphingomonas sp. Leaf208]
MDVDAFEAPLAALVKDIGGRLDEVETEADARFQIIDRLLIEALGWTHDDFRMERHNTSGYTDYLVQYRGTPALVIEAKRIGKLPIDTARRHDRSAYRTRQLIERKANAKAD